MRSKDKSYPMISVVILNRRNELFKEDYIDYSYSSVLNQNYPNMEVILVNNNSFPIELLCRNNNKGIETKVIDTKDISRGEARNRGVLCSKGEIILFLDDDTIICDSKAVSKIASFTRNKNYGFGAKRFWTYPPGLFELESKKYLEKIKQRDFKWLTDRTRTILPSGIDRITGQRDLLDFSFPANFGYVRRDLFDRVGGFSKEFSGYGSEDDYLGYCF